MKFKSIFLSSIALSLTAASSISAQGGKARFTIAETGQGHNRLADAVDAIGGGSGTIIFAPGTYRDCAVQSAGRVTYRAAIAGRSILSGGICEGKAALVLRGRSAVIDGIIFQNMRVPEGNGAGIRIEQGDVTVNNALFRDSEQGILSASDPKSSITIDRSTFQHLGRCDRGLDCAHSIYIGGYGAVSVTNSRFEKGDGGHYVKSRSPRVTITKNSFDDAQGRQTNYMIDLPEGARGVISGNVFVQGKNKDNWSTFIAVAAEGKVYSSSGLNIHSNSASFARGVERNTAFVAEWGSDGLRIANNNLARGITPYQKR